MRNMSRQYDPAAAGGVAGGAGHGAKDIATTAHGGGSKGGGSNGGVLAVSSRCFINRATAYREVFDVLVLGIDNVSQIFAVDLLLEDPHSHFVIELLPLQHVAADNLCNCHKSHKKKRGTRELRTVAIAVVFRFVPILRTR